MSDTPDTQPGTAVGYTRVSSQQQAANGYGLDAQRHKIEAWSATNGMTLLGTFSDEGVSGMTPPETRTGWERALRATEPGSTLVVARLDRVARDSMWQEFAIRSLIDRGLRLESVDEPDFGSDAVLNAEADPTRAMVRHVLVGFAEYERRITIAKLNAGRAEKKMAGGFAGGQVPYGWRNRDRNLEPDPVEQTVLNEIRRWRRMGWGYNKVASELNRRGIASKRSGSQWWGQTVRLTLMHPLNTSTGSPATADLEEATSETVRRLTG